MNNFMLHEKSLVETSKVGNGTRVWAFTHILPGAELGGVTATFAKVSSLRMK